MIGKCKAPGIPTSEFLLPEGLSVSVQAAERNRDKVNGIMGTSSDFDSSHIHWLGNELDYHLLMDWNDENMQQEKERLEQLNERLLSNNNDFKQVLELIDYMKSLVTKYGEKFYQKMLSFDAGEKEDECGNNRMYQSTKLGECILLGIRLGIEKGIIEQWKTKLKEEDSALIIKYIFPEEKKN